MSTKNLLKSKLKFHISHITSTIPHRGSTLIELLIVISIIAILISIGSVSYLSAQRQGRDAQRKSDLHRVASALEQYYADNNAYPIDENTGQIDCGPNPGDDTRAWGAPFVCDSRTYLSELPVDPRAPATPNYFYDAQNSEQRFVLSADLENDTDPAIIAGLPCTPEPGPPTYNYCIPNP